MNEVMWLDNSDRPRVGARTIFIEWSKLGLTGFGGPPAHIQMLRELCVQKNAWIADEEFEHATATVNLLPGPASTQLAIFSAWRVGGIRGALIGGLCFIFPGLVLILALANLFLSKDLPPALSAAAAGAGSAIAAVAIYSGLVLAKPSWPRRSSSFRWMAYLGIGLVTAAINAKLVVFGILISGLIELFVKIKPNLIRKTNQFLLAPIALTWLSISERTANINQFSQPLTSEVFKQLSWVALKVGLLAYGGGFVAIPLMFSDAVQLHSWMTSSEFLTATALGQITPGPVLHTVAVVGYAATGFSGAILATVLAFAPSFAFVIFGAKYFERIRTNHSATSFLNGAGPAAIGAIIGSAVPLSQGMTEGWQYLIFGTSLVTLVFLRRSIIFTLALASSLGVIFSWLLSF